MSDKTLIYNWEDAVRFIHERCNLSEDMIIEVLGLEEEYMRTIGVFVEEKENSNLWTIDEVQRMEMKNFYDKLSDEEKEMFNRGYISNS